jgi:hypothetical protein
MTLMKHFRELWVYQQGFAARNLNAHPNRRR